MDITLTSIGIIHSPFTEPSQAPIQASRSNATGSVEVFPEFAEGLRDLNEFSHIFLLYLINVQRVITCMSNRSWMTRNTASLPRAILADLTQLDSRWFIYFV